MMDFKKHYKLDAEVFDYFGSDQLSQNERRRNYFVFNNFPIRKGETILEIGSGRGWFSLEMAKRGYDVTAVDLSQKNLDTIKEKCSRITTIYASADNLPIKETKYDWIVLNEVLEHLESPEDVLNHLKGFLTPRGKLFISVPYNEKIVQELCIHCHELTPHNAHLHSFNEKSLERLASKCGLYTITTHKYLHKLFTRTGLITLMSFLPNALFDIKDQVTCLLYNKPEYISIVLMKDNL